MSWVNALDRLPDKTGEYQVKRLTAQGREVSDKCYYEKKGKRGWWYSMQTGNKIYKVQEWLEEVKGSGS